ncbi:MAG: hypothetical protein N3G78_11640 [Desulfobacterota bacterium]|nr:hypothetical protein [Thermodesulfobacteriota bacterium]
MALKRREKILLLGLSIAVAIFLFDRIFDTPANRKISALRGEIQSAEAKLSELALLAKEAETAEAELLKREEELERLSARTHRGEEFRTFLKHLARESDPFQMKVISITPFEEKIALPEEKKETPSSSRLRKVTVQLVLHATFSKIESYLKGVEELPFPVHVERLQIERAEEVQPLLKVTLALKMYIQGQRPT